MYATATEFRTIGDFELNWETQQYKCWISQFIAFGLLAAIQSLNLFWFFLILRIAYNAIITSHVDDERSEYEGSEDGQDTTAGAQEIGETTKQKRARFSLEETSDVTSLSEAPPPAASTRSKTNGHAATPQKGDRMFSTTANGNSDVTPQGSARRRKGEPKRS